MCLQRPQNIDLPGHILQVLYVIVPEKVHCQMYTLQVSYLHNTTVPVTGIQQGMCCVECAFIIIGRKPTAAVVVPTSLLTI